MDVRGVAAACLLVAGCSSSATPAPDASVNPSSGPQPVGQPCDPAIAVPCLPPEDPCLGVACDPNALVCRQYATDAGPACNGGAAACTKNTDCDVGLTCGFPIGAGCAVQGMCINPPLPCQADAAACATGGVACGCDGSDVPIVIPGFASAPTTGAGDCADAGVLVDSGTGVSDGGGGE